MESISQQTSLDDDTHTNLPQTDSAVSHAVDEVAIVAVAVS